MQCTDDPRNIFCNQRQNADKTEQPKQDTSDKAYREKVDEMKRLAEKYQRDGEGQLVNDIINNVIEQKAAGNLSNKQLMTFAKRIAPLLNDEQRTRLEGLLEQLLKL